MLIRVSSVVFCLCLAFVSLASAETARWHVIDRRMIETYDVGSVADALSLVPGFAAVRTHVKRNVATARGVLQPHYANRVLVLIHGVPAWHATTGEGSLDRVSIEDVERIEVLAGPASVTFGSQAYAGVINLVLRGAGALPAGAGHPRDSTPLSPGPAEVSGHVLAGVPSHYGAGMRAAAAHPRSTWMVAGSLEHREGREYAFEDETGEPGRIDEFTRTASFTASGTYDAGGTHRLLVNAFQFDETMLGTAPLFRLGMGHGHRSTGVLASYAWSRAIRERFTIEAGAAYDSSVREFSRSRDDNVRSDVEGRRVTISGALIGRLTGTSSFRAGLEFDNRHSAHYDNVDVRAGHVLERNNMTDRGVWERSAFAHYAYDGARFLLDAGLRLTGNEHFGRQLVGEGAAGYRVAPGHAVTLRAAQSYRSPTLFELYFETSERTVFGNVDLDPETGDMVEAEYSAAVGGVALRVSANRTRYDQQIFRTRLNPDNPADTALVYANGGPFTASGFEIEARHRDMFVAYTYVRGADGEAVDSPAAAFRFVPDHSLTAGASHLWGPVRAAGIIRYQSGVSGPSGAPEAIDAQARVDLSLTYHRRHEGFALAHVLSLDNATGSRQLMPEYVRQNINHVPGGFGRALIYRLRLSR